MAGNMFIRMACCTFVLPLLNWAHSDALFAMGGSVPGGTVGSSADEQFKIDLMPGGKPMYHFAVVLLLLKRMYTVKTIASYNCLLLLQ